MTRDRSYETALNREYRVSAVGEPGWPAGHQFALFLSHDVDQIHDRELWRVLADVNHVRRTLLRGEPGNIPLAAKRVGRALVRPKPAIVDFQAILAIEARHGFRSTFFVLHDRYWARNGARFRLRDSALRNIVELVRAAECEIGVHGGYYRFNRADAYRDSIEAFRDTFGLDVSGIRNHLLRFSGKVTWEAHAAAGFSYDATCGYGSFGGPGDVPSRPFWAVEPQDGNRLGLVELPLTVMDCRLLREARLGGEHALGAAWAAIEPVAASGGLVTLLWHNNYFNEPEYWDWQWVYERLLERLAALNPWCATGAEINRWWRKSRVGGLAAASSGAG